MTPQTFEGYSAKIAPAYILHKVLNDPTETAERKTIAENELNRRLARCIETFQRIDNAIGND